MRQKLRSLSPWTLLLLIILSIFSAELGIMFTLRYLVALSYLVGSILDGIILIIVLFPLLYFFAFKPLFKELAERKKTDETLQDWLVKYESLLGDLKKFKLAVESTSEQILISDSDGIALYANPAMEEITGYSISETLGKKVGHLWGGYMENSYYKKLWKTIKDDKKTFLGEVRNKRKSGEFYDASLNISPILDEFGKVQFFVSIERDITKIKEVDRMKTEFISLASHQLRTPLTAMKWFSEILLDEDAGKLTKEQKEAVDNIYKSNERMISLVNSLLNLSRIESGKIVAEKETINLQKLIDDVMGSLKSNYEEKKQSITLEVKKSAAIVKSDPKLLTQIYLNLISNAIKYSGEGAEITVEVEKEGGKIVSKVKDFGIGIPEGEKEKIFDRFYRASNAVTVDTEGSGLGLYLVKTVVESMGGKVWFENNKDKGTSFYFSLPLRED